jgi:hypothetical protein
MLVNEDFTDLPGDSLRNYIGKVCAKAILGALSGFNYIYLLPSFIPYSFPCLYIVRATNYVAEGQKFKV